MTMDEPVTNDGRRVLLESTPEYEAEISAVYEPCPHHQTELRRKITSNGQRGWAGQETPEDQRTNAGPSSLVHLSRATGGDLCLVEPPLLATQRDKPFEGFILTGLVKFHHFTAESSDRVDWLPFSFPCLKVSCSNG